MSTDQVTRDAHCSPTGAYTPLSDHTPATSQLSRWERLKAGVRKACRLKFLPQLILQLSRRVLLRHRLVYEVLLECRSLGFRIQTARKTKPWVYGTPLGPAAYRDHAGHLPDCSATYARMRDTQYMQSIHEAATYFDAALFLEGWEMGARWAAGEIRNGTASSESSGNMTWLPIMRQLVALQQSKRGPSIWLDRGGDEQV
jgi:hypothetical protein